MQPAESTATRLGTQLRQSQRATFVQVAWTLLLVLRSASASALCAWPILFCLGTGNVFSGRSAARQSRASFETAVLLWSKTLNWIFVCTSHTALVLPEAARKAVGSRPTYFACWRQVVRDSFPVFVVSTALTFATAIAGTRASEELHKYKPAFYATIGLFHMDTAASSLAGTRYFLAQVGSPPSQRRRSRVRRFAREFFKMLWNVGSFLIAAAYTHATLSFALSTRTHVVAFTGGSIAIKTAMQEVAKLHVFKLKLHNPGVMAALVGIPTILINTQMRVALLRSKSVHMALEGTFAMVTVEVALRFAKSAWVVRHIRRRQGSFEAQQASTASGVGGESSKSSHAPPHAQAGRTRSRDAELVQWRSRLLHYHAAEIYVDMVAEYMALGCSYAIVIVYWSHPWYQLGAPSAAAAAATESANFSDTDNDSSVLSNFQPIVFAVQLSLEIVADYIASMLEIRNGVDLVPLRKHNNFISVFLVWAVASNIVMTANLFLRERES